MEILIQASGSVQRVGVVRAQGGLRITRGDEDPLHVIVREQDENSLLLDVGGKHYRVRWARQGDELHLAYAGHATHVRRVEAEHPEELRSVAGSPVVRTPMPGRVLEVLVAVGQQVEAGQPVARVEAMKMEVALPSAVAGTVSEVHVSADQLVQPEDPLVTITPREAT